MENKEKQTLKYRNYNDMCIKADVLWAQNYEIYIYIEKEFYCIDFWK